MDDSGDDVRQKFIARLKERGMWLRLVWIAWWSTRDLSRAEDLVQETIMRVLDPDDLPWDGKFPFRRFMTYRLRHVFCDWMRRRMALEVPIDALVAGHDMRSEEPSPEDVVDQRRTVESHTFMFDRLMSELDASEPLAARCLLLWGSGISRQEQAAALGCTEDQVRSLHQLIGRRATRIREEQEASEQERMNALRVAASAAVPPPPPSDGAMP